MKTRILSCAFLVFAAAACVENKEELEVRGDGSAHVRLSAKGAPSDLAEGYPLPLAAPWRAANAATERWLAEVGTDTGGAAVQAAARAMGEEDVELAVDAEFADVAAIPASWAPASEPYAAAFLEHASSLAIERKGGRTLYVFERRYGARRFAGLDMWKQVDAGCGDDVKARMTAMEPLTPADWDHVAPLVARVVVQSSENFAREALAGIYTRGDASLATAGFERALRTVRDAVEPLVARPRLERIWAELCAHKGAAETLDPGLDLDRQVRDAQRRALAVALAGERVAQPTINAVLERLEAAFAMFDHTQDLDDESFEFRLKLPGIVVDVTFDAVSDGFAIWSFGVEDLHDRARVLRAVSVLE